VDIIHLPAFLRDTRYPVFKKSDSDIRPDIQPDNKFPRSLVRILEVLDVGYPTRYQVSHKPDPDIESLDQLDTEYMVLGISGRIISGTTLVEIAKVREASLIKTSHMKAC